MQEYRFTLKYDDYEASLALGGKWTLYELAEFLIKTLGFQFDHAFEFCDNLDGPYDSTERYTLFADMDDPDHRDPGVKHTLVSDVFRPKRAMIFYFDYGDDWHFLVTCTGVAESPDKRRFKKVLKVSGKPPEQYPEYEE